MYVFQMIDGLAVGGAQQLLITFAEEACRRGFKLAVISLSADDGSPYPERLRALGVTVYFFPTTRIFDFNNLRQIIKLFREERPDILHTHLTYSNIIGSIAAWLMHIPVVVTLHSTSVDERFRAPRTEKLERFILRHHVRQIIACGPAVAKYYRETVKDEPVLVIANAVNVSIPQISLSEREDLRKQIAKDANRPIIISVGRLVFQKGFQDLVDAFSILHQAHPEAFLAIAGDGDFQSALEAKIKDLNLSDHVRLLGRRNDISRLFSVSDMFVLASHWEGLPISVLEAMTAGLPVLATDVGDNAWALGDVGLTVPPHQPDLLAVAMQQLLEDPARRKALGQAARARCEENFNPTDWFDKIFSVYQSVLN